MKPGCSASQRTQGDRCCRGQRAGHLRGCHQRLRRDIRSLGINDADKQEQAQCASKAARERRFRLKRRQQTEQPRQLVGSICRPTHFARADARRDFARKNSRNSPAAAFHAASAPATGATTRSCSRFRSCWLQVIGQETLHLLSRVKQPRPHRADVALHHLRNFLMRQALHVMQNHDQSMVF